MVAEKKEKEGKAAPASEDKTGKEKAGVDEKVSEEAATSKSKESPASKVKGKKEGKVVVKEAKPQHRMVRLLEYTLNGDKKVGSAIRDIKGVGYRIASILTKNLNMENRLLGDLNADEISQLETGLKNISAIVPSWMLNHRNEQFTGSNLHLIGTDLDIAVKSDIEFMQKIRCYKGIRHIQGQPVRGQRTRTSFRKGKTVGVVKKKEAPAKAGEKGAPAAGGKPAAKASAPQKK